MLARFVPRTIHSASVIIPSSHLVHSCVSATLRCVNTLQKETPKFSFCLLQTSVPHTSTTVSAPFSTLTTSTLSSIDMSSSASPASRLRSLLVELGVDAFVIPTADAHQSEYVSEHDKRRAYISNFTGSAGSAVVLAKEVDGVIGRLWTDGRYFLQADNQLNKSEFLLMKQGIPGVPTIQSFLLQHLPAGSKVAIDATLVSIAQYKDMVTAFKDQLSIVSLETNPVDKIWAAEQPSLATQPLMIHSLQFAGEAVDAKVEKIRRKLKENHCYGLVVSALDEVCWLFNLRGSDIPFNPVFLSYAFVTLDSVTLFVDSRKTQGEVAAHLQQYNVQVQEYEQVWTHLKSVAGSGVLAKTNKVWLDSNKVNAAIWKLFATEHVHEAESPIAIMKSVKNQAELDGMRAAHVRDGAAVCNFLSWLEDEYKNNPNTSLSEVALADKLEWFRAQQPLFVGLSFDTISAVGKNGAIIHYKPEEKSCANLSTKEMYLLDSGAQYRDGTTDITRTVHLGTPTDFERETFTRVLQGHIGLGSAYFPPGTVGPSLDAFARLPLWKIGLDYAHGTGHGVGAFLNVHEGPQGISASVRSLAAMSTPLQSGMVLSNEPGYYHEGAFGIRIESLVIVQNQKTAHQFLNRQYLSFETITVVPIQRKLIQVDLLTDQELAWLNDYHRLTREKVAPLLSGNALQWLIRETEPITRK